MAGMTDDQDQPELADYALVLPFVVVASAGGPYDDAAFAAGWQCGEIDRRLTVIAEAGGTGYTATVQAPVVPQLDLIAMRHGFRMAAEDVEHGWVSVTFERGEA